MCLIHKIRDRNLRDYLKEQSRSRNVIGCSDCLDQDFKLMKFLQNDAVYNVDSGKTRY